MKEGLHTGNKMNSLARSNASLYGKGQAAAQDDLYDRLRRHAYQGKKSGNDEVVEEDRAESDLAFVSSDKSGNETTSDSDGQ